jgi:glc operon protein GlcG
MSSAPHVPPQLPVPYGPPLSLELAKRVMAAAETEAVAHHFPQAIVIVDSGGNLVMLHRLDQADLGSISVAQAKAQTAVNFRVPTKVLAEALASGGLGLLSVPNLVLVEGGLPIIVGGQIVGAIGVAGMEPTQDSQVAAAGVTAIQS